MSESIAPPRVGSPVYLRLGDLPPSGVSISKGHAEGWEKYRRWGIEPDPERHYTRRGVSCFSGYALGEGRFLLDLHGRTFTSAVKQVATYRIIMQRPAYLVTGKEVARGSDGEPLLEALEVHCEVPPHDLIPCYARLPFSGPGALSAAQLKWLTSLAESSLSREVEGLVDNLAAHPWNVFLQASQQRILREKLELLTREASWSG
jgi:hypothetical protein